MDAGISKVDLHCAENNKDHRTDQISTDRLIVRRGQLFQITLDFVSSHWRDVQALRLIFRIGPEPSDDLGTECISNVFGGGPSKKVWRVDVQTTTSLSLTLHITSLADASVGEYTLSVKTRADMTESHDIGTFVLLFNPWCARDWVYLASEEERQEYVLKEQGLVYTGTAKYIHGMDWDFGQYEEDILDICLKLLDLNPKCLEDPAKDFAARCSPIYVGRDISAMINCHDDSGVLMGNWGSSFHGGVPPTHWDSSVDILRKWKNSNFNPVKYGQCWVFAAVMCAVMRCLGIPCRVVTNFDSAHDTDGNLTIDTYYTETGVEEMGSKDSIWNFHVWVEAWMRRPDLSKDKEYDGWQVLDPTPQELSDGVHCCGPAPVKAILEGHTDVKYDLPFIFSEVNADYAAWKIKEDGTHLKLTTFTDIVGRNITTKSVGSDEKEDITGNYKYPEGTDKEREVFYEAVKRTEWLKDREYTPDELPPKISIKIEEQSKPSNGKDVELVIVMLSPEPCDLLLYINAQVMLYNGILESHISSEEKQVQLLANEELTVPFQIPYAIYGGRIQGNNSIKVTVEAINLDNIEEEYLTEINISPNDPPFSITIHGDPVQFKYLHAEINFDNPLDEPLNDVSITVTCSGFLREPVETRFSSVGVGHQARAIVVFAPYRSGSKKLIAILDCDKFCNIQSSCRIDVAPHCCC